MSFNDDNRDSSYRDTRLELDHAARRSAAEQIANREPREAARVAADIESTDPQLARLIRTAIERRENRPQQPRTTRF